LRGARLGWPPLACDLHGWALIGITIPDRLRQRRDHSTLASMPMAIRFTSRLAGISRIARNLSFGSRQVDGRATHFARSRTAGSPRRSVLSTRMDTRRTARWRRPRLNPSRWLRVVWRCARLPAGLTLNLRVCSFTSYELRLPSEHRLLASDDDFVLRDGVIVKVNPTSSR
jgi:hypothetical protein